MFIKSNKYNEEWHKVFLWFPKRSKDGTYWLCFAYRRYLHYLNRPLLLKDEKYEYKLK